MTLMPSFVKAVFQRPEEVVEIAAQETAQKTAQKTTQKTTQKKTQKRTQKQQAILDFLKAHPEAGRKDIADNIDGVTEERQDFLIVTFKAAIAESGESIIKAPVTAPVTAPVLRLLEILYSKGPLGNTEILMELGLKNRRRMRENYITPALRLELIEYTIPDKPNSRLQKYRLTEKGSLFLSSMQGDKKK
ncbi:MAG: hypothetical protein GX654_09605 [Desulfatiglans sp.]|nr:hypothetical protein [Desulfatiglans sp.]